MPEADGGEDALHLRRADQLLLQGRAGEFRCREEACPGLPTEGQKRQGRQRGGGRDRAGDRLPLAAGQQGDGDEQAQVRLEDQCAEAGAGQEWPPAEQQAAAAEQRCGQEGVLAVAQVEEGRREGQRRHHPFRAPKPAPDGQPASRAGERQPSSQRREIGQHRQRQADQQEDRRIEEGGVAHVRAAEHRTLSGGVDGGLVDGRGVAGQRQLGRGPEAQEVGAKRLAGGVEAAMREREPARDGHDHDASQDPDIGPGARAIEPVRIAQDGADGLGSVAEHPATMPRLLFTISKRGLGGGRFELTHEATPMCPACGWIRRTISVCPEAWLFAR